MNCRWSFGCLGETGNTARRFGRVLQVLTFSLLVQGYSNRSYVISISSISLLVTRFIFSVA